jgi:ribulose-5-phosphate 4-epimerase/fuculose-1-phosphate aldolase
MSFASSPELRAEMLTACRVLTHFRIVEGFGHVSARIPGTERILITPRRALGLVSEAELVELDFSGRQVAGEQGRPPLEVPMHLAVYRRRPDVMAIARGHPRHVAAYACAGEPLRVAHGFGANLGPMIEVFGEPFLVANSDMAEGVADALGNAEAVILQSNGMLAVGQTVPHACVQALFLEETAELQLLAEAAGFTPRFYAEEGAARRHGDDRVHEPIRAWEYYLAATDGKLDGWNRSTPRAGVR